MLKACIQQIFNKNNTGIINEDVDSAMQHQRLFSQPLRLFWTAQINLQCMASTAKPFNRMLSVLEPSRVATADYEIGTSSS